MKKLLTILPLFILWSLIGYSQTYPVSVATTLTPPYSVYLADYVAPGSDRLAVNLFLGDVNRPELQVKLRLRIEGQGIIIATKPEYLPPPLILQGGVPQRLIAADLADYLAPQNLNFTGITRQQFERTGALPEGLYRFCFEVLEYNRGVKISNTGCTMAWMILNDPPLINLPRQNEKIRPQDPQFVTFQWTPRHTGSPNSAFRTEYEFSMVELWPATRNPNDAIFTMPPIHQVTTQSTTLIYGPAETPLVAGRSYAFRVKAKSIVGVDELDLFKNNGYSETVTFTYGDACTLPTNISAEAVNAGKFKVIWQANYNHSGFSVRYKLADNPTAEWYEEDTFFEEIEIGGLQPETTYEYQVSGSCGAFTSEFSAIAKITTPALPQVNFTCGLPPENFQLDNTTPVEGLKVGDVIKAGDFDVKVVELTPNGNRYTGKGNVVVPYLDNLLVSVDFLNIEVNTDYRLFAGEMDIIGIGLDIIPPELSELLDKLDEGLASLDDLLGDISAGLDLADEILDAVGDLANDIMDNGPFTDEEEAELDGISVEEYNTKAKEALADAIGAIANAKATDDYEVVARKVAQAMTLKKRANKLKNIYNSADTLNVIAVEFYENTVYGFDAQKYPQHRLHYNIIITDSTDATTNTAIPWAAVKENEEVTVKARLIPDKGIAADNIIFKTAEGDALTANRNGDECTVQLPQLTHEQILSINAIDSETNQTVGKLQAIGYTPIEKRVILVAVNGQTAPSISQVESYLNTHYKQAVASWKVEIGTPLQVDGFDGTLQDDEQATLSTYSAGMKTIIRAFTKDTTTIDKEAFYLFMVNKSSEGNAGYMPRKHRYGFIYMGETQANVNRTIAHELGHGAFRLQHTWEEYPNIAQGSSQNLMDYGTGTTLRKYQWDLIHNPPLVIGLVEDMSEGALLDINMSLEEYTIAFMSNPPWVRAALVLRKFLDNTGYFDDVTISCTTGECKIVTSVIIGENARLEQEITISSDMDKWDVFLMLSGHYKVPFWETNSAYTENFWEAAINFMRNQDEKVVNQEGFIYYVFVDFPAAMVVNATGIPFVYGLVTGENIITRQELEWWEHVLGAFDVIPAEALAKAGITAVVIRIGDKIFDLTKVTNATRGILIAARHAGIKVVIKTANEIILYGKQGTKQIGKFVNGVLQDIIWISGGDKVLAKLSGVRYIVDNKTVNGALEIVEKEGKIGIRLAEAVVKSADELMDFVIANGIRADIDLDYVIKFTKGRRDLCESVLLSTKEVVDGKNVQQLIQHFNIPDIPSANSLSNYQSRIWYHYKKSNIPNLLDNTKSIEIQAQQAFNLRNQYRIQARDFMSDKNLADFLIANEPNLTWSGYVNYLQTEKGLSGSNLWNYIINSASSGRDGVDALFKLN